MPINFTIYAEVINKVAIGYFGYDQRCIDSFCKVVKFLQESHPEIEFVIGCNLRFDSNVICDWVKWNDILVGLRHEFRVIPKKELQCFMEFVPEIFP